MIKIRQVKSSIGRTKRQKDTLKALGLKGINQSVEHADSPQIRGMIEKVRHLVELNA